MSKKTNNPPSSKSFFARFVGTLLNVITTIYILGFLVFRVVQILTLGFEYSVETLSSLLAFFIMAKITPLPWNLMAILGMVALVYITDDFILAPIPAPKPGTVVAITGANSGVGFETAKALAQYSSVIVIMACRSLSKCQAAAESIRDKQGTSRINVIPMELDLNSFDSVHQFADSVKQTIGKPVDVLLNNAGYSPWKHEPVNEYGLDPSFTSMHLSHHLLAELLVERNPKLRLVSTASAKHHFCAVFGKANGCITEEYLSKNIHNPMNDFKYPVAKVSNVLHAMEFPLRHPKASALAIDLGFVGTSIRSWFTGQLSPTSLRWMRSGSIGIHLIMQAILQPYKERDWATQGGVTVGVLGKTREPFTHPWWTGDLSAEKMKHKSKILWQKSTEILKKHGCTVCQ